MCCRKNRQQSFVHQPLYSPPRRGCCKPRLAQIQSSTLGANSPSHQRPNMAGLIAVGIGLGVEKLGRTISDKRLERKEKKVIAQHESVYGSSSLALPPPTTTRERQSRAEKKRQEARRALDEARREQPGVPQYESRRPSINAERVSIEEPPPSYEDAMRHNVRRA